MRIEGHWEQAGPSSRLDASGGDFVATLGARVTDLRRTVDSLSKDPSSALRTRFLRRLHALGAAARSLGFCGVAQRLVDMKALLEAGQASQDDLASIGRALGEIADVANGETEAPWIPDGAAGTLPATVCVVGDESVEALLRDPSASLCVASDATDSPLAFASARVADPSRARSQLGPYAPDLFLVDLDLPGAVGLIRDLVDDPRTDLVPIVAITAELAEASECAALGVTRTFSKPVDVAELRKTCIDAVEQRRGRTIKMTLPPEPGAARAAVAALSAPGRRAQVVDDVNVSRACAAPSRAPVETSARVEEELALSISAEEIELAIDDAPFREEPVLCLVEASVVEPVAALASPVVAPVQDEVSPTALLGRRVVVASGEPAVGWFISAELAKWGCTVDEAPAGGGARDLVLEVGRRDVVDLLIADVDGADSAGLSLVRAMRADSVARDAAIILLSRDEVSLRTKVGEELAVACVRLGSPIAAIVAAAVELMAKSGALEHEVRAGREASGSLADVTPRRLVAIAEEAEVSCRIRLFDGVYLHELSVVRGGLRRATRAAPSGRVEVGERALATALGLDYGSFSVEPLDADSLTLELEKAPEPTDLLTQTIRMRSAMKRCLEGLDVARVARVTFDEDMVHFARTLEGPARAIVDQLLAGFSPRLLSHMAGFAPGNIAATIEMVLERGFVVAVRDELADLGAGQPVGLLPPAKEEPTAPSPPVSFDEEAPSRLAGNAGERQSVDPAASPKLDVSAYRPWFREDPRQLTPPPPVPAASTAQVALKGGGPRLELSPPLIGRTAMASEERHQAIASQVDELSRPEESPALPEFPVPGVPRSDAFLATSVTAAPPPPVGRARARTAALLLVVASVVGVAARFVVSTGAPRAPLAAAAAAAPVAARPASPPTPALPPQGLLEVTAPETMAIVVDGTERGHGPKLSITLAEGTHELLTDTSGANTAAAKKRFVDIARGRVTHVDLTLAVR